MLVIAFFVALRDRWSMWLDEAFSSAIVRQSAPDLAHQLWNDEANHAPYYWLLWGWSRISDAVWFERSLSLVGTLVAIWGVWLLARRWAGSAGAAVSVAVFCTLPFTLAWSLQARGYTWVMAVVAWTLVALDLRADRRSRWWAVAAGIGIGLCTAISLASACFIAPALLTFVAIGRSRQALVDAIVVTVSAVLAFSPFAWAFAVNRGQIGWIAPLTTRRFTSALHAAAGTHVALVILAIGLAGCTVAIVFGRTSPRALAPVLGAVGGVVLLALVSVFVQPMFVGRYLAPAIPMAAVACGVAVAAVPVRWSRIAVVSSITLTAVVLALSLEAVRPEQLEDWRGATELVEARWRGGDLLMVAPHYAGVAMIRYWPGNVDSAQTVRVAEGVGGNLGLENADDRPVDAQRRVWFVVRGDTRSLPRTDRAILRAARTRSELVRVVHLDGVRVMRLDGSPGESSDPDGDEVVGR